MEILAKEKYNEFETFVSNHKNGNFTQTIEWAKLKSNWGHEIVVSRDGNGNIVGGMLVLINYVPVLKYSLLYSPHGPVCDYDNAKVLSDLLEGAKQLAKKYNAFLFKIDPCVFETDTETINRFLSLGFKNEPGKKDFETIQTRYNYGLTDIYGKTEDEVIMSFTQKTRYNIRVAKKHNVECRICDKSHIPEFVRLMNITSKRDKFTPRPQAYYERMMDVFGEHIRLYLCYYQDRAISGAICVQFAGKTWYVYGASDNEYRNVMPNYLMQWEMIRWALQGNCHLYDFLGIPVNADPNSPMIGVYRFKKGFNGTILGYAGEFDYVFKPAVNNLFTLFTKAKRKYNQHKLNKQEKAENKKKGV